MKTATIIDLIVDSDVHTQSMNHIIKQQHISQRMRRRLRNEGIITVNDEPATWNTLVHGGDHLVMKLTPEQEFSLSPMDLDIVYEDEHILVINKAAGVLMHPTSTVRDHTLANGVLYYYQETHQHYDFHPVHRLDKDTSGVMMAAKNDAAHIGLAEQVKEHSAKRTYWALVQGNIVEEKGTIKAPIGRHPKDRMKMAVVFENSKDAVTHFRVLERYGHQTLVECNLETGRTHQIRVHFAHIGHPVVNDPFYGYRRMDFPIEGQALHSKSLDVKHPITGEEMHFEAPVPADFEACLEFAKTYREDKRK